MGSPPIDKPGPATIGSPLNKRTEGNIPKDIQQTILKTMGYCYRNNIDR